MKKPSLRPFQRQAIAQLLKFSQIHLICVARTGAGKSRIFEELARIPGSRTLIVSPLRALVRQQKSKLSELGVQIVERLDQKSGQALACVLTPEQLAFRADRGLHVPPETLVVIDECHCIESWGRQFRPAFQRIPELIERFSIRKSLWLSATLTPSSRNFLTSRLSGRIRTMGNFSLNENLRVDRLRIPWRDRPSFLRGWLEHHPEPGILFCSTRAQCLEVGRLLEAWCPGTSASYHAGLTSEERCQIESGIRDGRIRRIAATSAFGMGMDFSSLRWVILWQVPFSPLDLAQMIGRCGRIEGETSRAALLWDDADLHWLKGQVNAADFDTLCQIYRSPREVLQEISDAFEDSERQESDAAAFQLTASQKHGKCYADPTSSSTETQSEF